ncbi:MAG: hypothetical protein WC829_10630, partial [Hyphomicrobium sp.]
VKRETGAVDGRSRPEQRIELGFEVGTFRGRWFRTCGGNMPDQGEEGDRGAAIEKKCSSVEQVLYSVFVLWVQKLASGSIAGHEA